MAQSLREHGCRTVEPPPACLHHSLGSCRHLRHGPPPPSAPSRPHRLQTRRRNGHIPRPAPLSPRSWTCDAVMRCCVLLISSVALCSYAGKAQTRTRSQTRRLERLVKVLDTHSIENTSGTHSFIHRSATRRGTRSISRCFLSMDLSHTHTHRQKTNPHRRDKRKHPLIPCTRMTKASHTHVYIDTSYSPKNH
jgi:hypothetical protein